LETGSVSGGMAEIRFSTGWRRFFPLVGYHHVLMILIAVAIILLCKFGPELDLFLLTTSSVDRLTDKLFLM
jgi:hypothetical protein